MSSDPFGVADADPGRGSLYRVCGLPEKSKEERDGELPPDFLVGLAQDGRPLQRVTRVLGKPLQDMASLDPEAGETIDTSKCLFWCAGPSLYFVPGSPWAFDRHLNPYDLEWLKYTGEGCDIIKSPDGKWAIGWWSEAFRTYWPIGWTNETREEFGAPDWAWTLDELTSFDVATWCIQRGFAFPPELLLWPSEPAPPVYEYVKAIAKSWKPLESYAAHGLIPHPSYPITMRGRYSPGE
jgi:hypothetical protein